MQTNTVWILQGHAAQGLCRCQQGRGGVTFWALIVEDEVLGPFRVADGVKINSDGYSAFFEKHFFPWYNQKTEDDRNELIFMQDNATSHVSKYSRQRMSNLGLDNFKLMAWPAQSLT